jgi:tetratricopeptide (TPR) repeat protein
MATLRLDTLAVPLPIQVDAKRVVADSLREQLRGLGRFFWQPWNQAAAWCAGERDQLQEATTWADRSIAINENFTNLRVKAGPVGQAGRRRRRQGAAPTLVAVASEADMNTYGYLLMGQDKVDSAVVVFQKNVKDYPKSWNAYDSLGEAYAKKGDVRRAISAYTQARKMCATRLKQQRIDGILAGLQHPG